MRRFRASEAVNEAVEALRTEVRKAINNETLESATNFRNREAALTLLSHETKLCSVAAADTTPELCHANPDRAEPALAA